MRRRPPHAGMRVVLMPLLLLGVLSSPAALQLQAPAPAEARTTAPPLVVIVLENKEYASIVGSTSARYLGRTVHPERDPVHELPRRRTSVAAELPGHDLGDRQRLPRRRLPAPLVPHQQHLPSAHDGGRRLASLDGLDAVPLRLRSSGMYAVKHNPAAYYSNLFPHTCRAHDVPYPSTLPALATVHVHHARHLRRHARLLGAHGDHWLRNEVPGLWAPAPSSSSRSTRGPSSEGGGGHVVTAVSGPGIEAGTTDRRGLRPLRAPCGIEDWFGDPRQPHPAKTHRPLPLT